MLGLLTVYRREDLARALERACRYRAFSWSAMEILRRSPLAPRSTADYQPLLEEADDDEKSYQSEDDGPDDPAA